jgi:hypothetical protein
MHTTNASLAVTKAVVRTAQLLQLAPQSLSQILGLPSTMVVGMFEGTYALSEGEGEKWERAMLLVHLYQLLDTTFGGPPTARRWLQSDSKALSGRPADLICCREGLARVFHYLEAQQSRA